MWDEIEIVVEIIKKIKKKWQGYNKYKPSIKNEIFELDEFQ